MTRQSIRLVLIALLIGPVGGSPGHAGEPPLAAANKQDLGLITGSTRRIPEGDPQLYCVNIADEAADARAAWQAKRIAELEAQLGRRIAELEAKRAEYEQWIKRREEILARASEHLVGIYAKMKPAAAALQLAALDDETAAGVLAKLKPRAASAILTEMEPARAAQVTKAIVHMTQDPKNGKRS